MLLRLKQGIKVPEAALNKVVGWHFSETVNNHTTDISTETTFQLPTKAINNRLHKAQKQ